MMLKIDSKSHYIVYLSVAFFNTFVDIGHKVLIQDIFYQTSSPKTFTIMSAIVNAMILLPYIAIFTPSGFIADKFPKTTVLRLTAFAALPLTILITIFYYLGYFWLAFNMTLLLAVQSTLNSPAKYGYIKELFGKEHLAEINGYVQTTVIIAILASTFAFSAIFQHMLNTQNLLSAHLSKSLLIKAIAPIGFLLVLGSVFESFCTLFLFPQKAAAPEVTFSIKDYIYFKDVRPYLTSILANPTIFICILGLSVFWGVNQVILANYGAYLKEYVNNASVLYAQGSLACGGVGILLGALFAGRVSKNYIEAGIVPIAALGIILGSFLIPMVINKFLIVLLFFGYGFFSGMFLVPLNALIQFNAPDQKLGRILAGNNFMQNIFMFIFLILTATSAYFNFDSVIIFRFICLITILGTIYLIIKLPQALVRCLFTKKPQVNGIKNIPSSGRVILLGSSANYFAWAILQVSCPRPIRFVMDCNLYPKWYWQIMFKLLRVIPITNKNAEQLAQNALQQDQVVAILSKGFSIKNWAPKNVPIVSFHIDVSWNRQISVSYQSTT